MLEIILNKEQQEAVQYCEGPLLIIAGAGTGKTRVISEKIKYLIKNKGYKPRDILAVTYTEKAASEMEERVSEFLPLSSIPPEINTFHGLCFSIIRNEGLHIGISPDFKLSTTPEQLLLLIDNLSSLKLKHYKPLSNPTGFLSSLLRLFSTFKSENISSDDLKSYIRSKEDKLDKGGIDDKDVVILKEDIERRKEELFCYEKYNEILRENNVLDYGDVIMFVYKLFSENKSILKKYQEKYNYILIDEYQDTNIIQNEIIKLLGLGHQKICVVGDDDQSIFRFQGASLSNILEFTTVFPETKKVVLTENYRSGQKILDASYELININNPDRLEERERINKKLVSVNKIEDEIVKVEASSLNSEISYIAQKIKERNRVGVPYSEMAVLYRSHATSELLVPVLKKEQIPFYVMEGVGLYDREEIMEVRNLIKFVVNPDDPISLFQLLRKEKYALDPLFIVRMSRFAEKNNISLWTALNNYLTKNSKENNNLSLFSAGLDSSQDEKLKQVIEALKKLIELQFEKSAVQVVYEILYGFFGMVAGLETNFQGETIEKEQIIANLAKFYRRVERFELSVKDRSIKYFDKILDTFIEVGEDPEQAEIDINTDCVKLYTIHKAKGLEFDTVFLMGLQTRKFPSDNRGDAIEVPEELIKSPKKTRETHIQEERRLMYVAMTRAKKSLHLIHAKSSPEAKKEIKASIFFNEVNNKYCNVVDYNQEIKLTLSDLHPKDELNDIIVREDMRLQDLDTIISLSYSNISSFNNCPLKFKYQTIYKIPSEPLAHLKFGQYVHRILEKLHASINQGVVPSEDSFIKLYYSSWNLLNVGFLDQEHVDDYKKEGEKILRKYYQDNKNNFKKAKFLEKRFKITLKNLTVNGVIDRIDLLDDESCEIVDYKTGKPKNEKEIRKEECGFLQLYIYAMYCQDELNLIPEKLSYYYLTDGSKVTITPTPEELAFAEEFILRTANEIKKGDFKAKPEKRKCSFCEYRRVCPSKA